MWQRRRLPRQARKLIFISALFNYSLFNYSPWLPKTCSVSAAPVCTWCRSPSEAPARLEFARGTAALGLTCLTVLEGNTAWRTRLPGLGVPQWGQALQTLPNFFGCPVSESLQLTLLHCTHPMARPLIAVLLELIAVSESSYYACKGTLVPFQRDVPYCFTTGYCFRDIIMLFGRILIVIMAHS